MDFFTILTNVGKAKIANAIVTGNMVNITHFAVGDGNGSAYVPVQTQTALKKEVYRNKINQIKKDTTNNNWAVVEGQIPSTAGDFTIREIAFFDVSGDMIAIGNYPETYKPIIDSGASKDLYIKTIIEVSNTAAINITVDQSLVIATQEFVNDAIEVSNKIGARLPILELNFQNGISVPHGECQLEFTRASEATYLDSWGNLKTAAINEPRCTEEGFLCEGPSTNYLLQSANLTDSGWIGLGIATPTIVNGVNRMVEDTTSSQRRIYRTFSLPASNYFITYSVRIKPSDNRKKFSMYLYDNSDATYRLLGQFNLADNTYSISSSGTAVTSSKQTLKKLADGSYLLTLTAYFSTPTVNTSAWRMMLYFARNDDTIGNATYTGDGASYVDFYYGQAEIQQGATSYIPTTTTAVSRAGDFLNLLSTKGLISNPKKGLVIDTKFKFNFVKEAVSNITDLNQSVFWSINYNYLALMCFNGSKKLRSYNGTASNAHYTTTYDAVADKEISYKSFYKDNETAMTIDDSIFSHANSYVNEYTFNENEPFLRIGTYTTTAGWLEGHIKYLRFYNLEEGEI
ncbi:MAG: phage tail protein [Campylobacteraceae bacterium]